MTEAIVTNFTCTGCRKTRREVSGTWGEGGTVERSEVCKACIAKDQAEIEIEREKYWGAGGMGEAYANLNKERRVNLDAKPRPEWQAGTDAIGKVLAILATLPSQEQAQRVLKAVCVFTGTLLPTEGT